MSPPTFNFPAEPVNALGTPFDVRAKAGRYNLVEYTTPPDRHLVCSLVQRLETDPPGEYVYLATEGLYWIAQLTSSTGDGQQRPRQLLMENQGAQGVPSTGRSFSDGTPLIRGLVVPPATTIGVDISIPSAILTPPNLKNTSVDVVGYLVDASKFRVGDLLQLLRLP